MAELYESNTLLLVNIADGKDSDNKYYLHIRYSDDPNGKGELSETPATYIGFYVGVEENAPSDGSKYTWSKYSGDSNYIDIRYSNDGESFTENNGKTQGSWMGVFITNNPDVLLETYEPKWEDYNWTDLSAATGASTPFYYIESNYKIINKFFNSDLEYEYSPSNLKLYFKVREADTVGQVSRGRLQIYYTYYELNNRETLKTSEIFNESSETEFNLTQDQFSKQDLQTLVVQGVIEEQTIVTEVFQINYGTTEDMAKLSLNASDIVASIQNTKLVFNTEGLTVKNGGLSILNSQDEKVFYADENGNLFFTGTLSTSSGNLGGWKIDEYGLYSDNGTIGLYAGGDLFHPDDTLKSPIRFWAGQYVFEDEVNYNFAVNHNGYLFANNANINGKIVATDGYIENKFLIGSGDNGIIIFGGNEDLESYIGSALYSSGALGYGWKLSQDGTAEFNNIIARGKIQSSVFEYNKISSVGGSLYIAPTIYIETGSTEILRQTNSLEETSEIVTLIVNWVLPYPNLNDINGRNWQINDEIKLDGDILLANERIELSNIDGIITEAVSNNDRTVTVTISFQVKKDQADKIVGSYFQPGAILILYGSEEKRHGLYLTAAGEHSPFMDVYDDSDDNVIKPAVRIGNLSGVNDINFPEATLSGYGLYSSNAYLRGQLMLPGAGITNQDAIKYGEGETSSEIRIWAGINNIGDDITNANFIVTANGYLYAKQGIFEGTVKAKNSEFSGTIKAAGIVINPGSDGSVYAPARDHFFVAYNDNPQSFNDYVLDIGSHGISIWEGALKAYSDYASGLEETTYINPIYGYSSTQTNPQPYFSLADDGNGEILNARIIAHKGHFLTINQNGSSYKTNSIIFDNGIWFDTGIYNNLNNIEKTAYYQTSHSNGISLKNNLLNLNNDQGLSLTSKETIYINPIEIDIDSTRAEKVLIRGQLNLIKENEELDNLISLNGQVIKEAFNSNKSIGIDIIVS